MALVLRLKVGESFLETIQRTQEHNSVVVQKNPDYEMRQEIFIRNWQRSGLKNPDKPEIFIKNNVKNHSYHQFYPVLMKI